MCDIPFDLARDEFRVEAIHVGVVAGPSVRVVVDDGIDLHAVDRQRHGLTYSLIVPRKIHVLGHDHIEPVARTRCVNRPARILVLADLAGIDVPDSIQLPGAETVDRGVTQRNHPHQFVQIGATAFHPVVFVAPSVELTCIVRLDELEWSGSNAVISHLLKIVLGFEHHCSVFGQGKRQFGVGSLQMQSDGVLADLFRLGNRVLDQAHTTEHVKVQRGDDIIGGQFGAVVEHDTFVQIHLPHVQCIIGRERASQFQLRIQVFVNPGESVPDRARQKVDVVVRMFASI